MNAPPDTLDDDIARLRAALAALESGCQQERSRIADELQILLIQQSYRRIRPAE